jgi:hypothetical protein
MRVQAGQCRRKAEATASEAKQRRSRDAAWKETDNYEGCECPLGAAAITRRAARNSHRVRCVIFADRADVFMPEAD